MQIRKMLEEQEHQTLHPAATFSDESQGRQRKEKSCPLRPIFQHDRDKILHCKSFRRLMHKTQVFLTPKGDHYRTRMTHTLEVSQIARTLARGLGLNEYLTEAIALSHDLGHTPFGHAGEDALHKLMPKGFRHVDQSVRVVEVLEKDGKGLNLSREVVDGIAKHSKGRGKILSGADSNLPMTLEGQLVRVADIIAYVNHDLDDALRGGVLNIQDVPKNLLETLGKAHSKRIGNLVKDILDNTDLDHTSKIVVGSEMEEALKQMRDFLWDRVYENPTVHGEFIKCQNILEALFELFLEQPEFFDKVAVQKSNQSNKGRRQAICDFLAGMTDRYAIQLYEELFMPKPWPLM
jgi:dGTPase